MNRRPFKRVIDEIALESAHAGSGSRRLIISQRDDISRQIEAVTKGYLEPGNVFDWHQHVEIDEFWIVISGNGFIEYKNGDKFEYKSGDFIYNPADLPHRIVAEGATRSEFFFIRVLY